jgi:alcohol dehydrogenase class IV
MLDLSLNKILVLTGNNSAKSNGNLASISRVLKQAKITHTVESNCPPNPDFEFLLFIANKLEKDYDCIIALGGGSVMDIAKGAALFSANLNSNDELSLVNNVKELAAASCKIIAVPTTVGTGSEANGTFIVNDKNTGQRKDFFHLSVRPHIAWLDPKHVRSLTKASVENGLIDVLSHLLEQYFSDEEELIWNDYQILGLLEYCVECYNKLDTWKDSAKFRNEVQMVSLISMSYLFAQGKTLTWSLHNNLELKKISNYSHSSVIRKYLPNWVKEKLIDKRNSIRFEKINYILNFIKII